MIRFENGEKLKLTGIIAKEHINRTANGEHNANTGTHAKTYHSILKAYQKGPRFLLLQVTAV